MIKINLKLEKGKRISVYPLKNQEIFIEEEAKKLNLCKYKYLLHLVEEKIKEREEKMVKWQK